ncbi:MAG: DUF4238 domain-containing protein [Xanthobacteraceae bacterium]
MPLDHYVSQVHLRQFYSPSLPNLMFAIRKSDLKAFCCNSKSVCRIADGSNNHYLSKDRLIEEFLKNVEPNYNRSLDLIYKDRIDQGCILSIAGFAAYVLACSPAGMRIFSDPLRASLESTTEILDRRGRLSSAPEALGGKSLTELLGNGTVKFTIDPKFPQALGIKSILSWVSVFGNSRWDILHNETDSPFFTSDFPIGLEISRDPRVSNRIIPLAPNLAIRICPDIRLSGSKPDLSFKKFRFQHHRLRRQETIEINKCIVRCAEDLVFYRDNSAWISPFVSKNRNYHVAGLTERIPFGRGFLNLSTQRIVLRSADDQDKRSE